MINKEALEQFQSETIKLPAETVQMMLKDNTAPKDRERLALFFIMGSVEKLTRLQGKVYDFEDHSINPDCLEELSFSSGERKILLLAYNLYNGWECPTPYHLFSSFGEEFRDVALKAIQLRFN